MKFPLKFKKFTPLTVLLTAAVIAACVLTGCDSGKTGDDDGTGSGSVSSESTKAPESTAPGTDATDTDAPDTDAPETEAPVIEPHDVTARGAIYHVYADHAVLTGTDLSGSIGEEVKVAEEIEGVPVTDIEDDAFKSDVHMCVICGASSAIYEKVRSCAVASDQIFLESDSGKLPDHYYPDWVVKLNWHERDRSGDDFIAVDDNARITELVGAYLGGDESAHDELLRRVIYRAACAERFSSSIPRPERFSYYEYDSEEKYDQADSGVPLSMTDVDRYDYISSGIPLYYRFAYGYIDTYDELRDYAVRFYTEEKANEFLNDDTISIDGIPYKEYAGVGSNVHDNFTFEIEVKSDKITLRMLYDDWGCDDVQPTEKTENTVTLEKHGENWQLTCDVCFVNALFDLPNAYVKLYGTSDVE